MDKMVMIVYNEAIDDEVMEALEKCSTHNYTKVTGIFGKGNASGVHLGNDIWPGRNNILLVACAQADVKKLVLAIRELRGSKLGKEGIKAFVLPLEEIT